MKKCFENAIRFIVMGLLLANLSCQNNKQGKIENEKQQLFQLIQTKNKTKNKHVNLKNENSERGQINPQRGSSGIGNYDFGTIPGTDMKIQIPVKSATDLKKQKKSIKPPQ
ncbi:MAG: hypothetical protein PF689_03810 [Deltaproteobacteria bacterium]|jgi:hypothetical protein|nr:hypothetical protein [Deltaproteobacteria bacterium]